MKKQFVWLFLFTLTASCLPAGNNAQARGLLARTQSQSATPAPAKPESSTESSLAAMPAAEVMRLARLLYIRPRSSRFNKEKLERELLKRREFGELGLEITRKASDANLVLEVTRKRFTTRFTCSLIEPSSERVVGSTTASSLGGEIEPNLAEAIIKQFKAARSRP